MRLLRLERFTFIVTSLDADITKTKTSSGMIATSFKQPWSVARYWQSMGRNDEVICKLCRGRFGALVNDGVR